MKISFHFNLCNFVVQPAINASVRPFSPQHVDFIFMPQLHPYLTSMCNENYFVAQERSDKLAVHGTIICTVFLGTFLHQCTATYESHPAILTRYRDNFVTIKSPVCTS